MDEKVGDRVNVLNLARYQTRQKQARLHDLQMQYKQFADDDAASGNGNGSGGSGGERGGSAGGKQADTDGKTDGVKSADNKEDEDGQVII